MPLNLNLEVLILLGISFLALLASACFSAAEVAIFSIRHQTLRTLRERQEPRLEWIEEILAQPRRFLITLLFGNVVANATFACGLVLLCHERGFSRWQSTLWLPMIVTSALLLLFGELIPKAVATRRIIPVALKMVGGLRVLERTMRPFITMMDRLSQQWLARLTPSSVRPLPGLTEEEYMTTLDIGTREGALRPFEKSLIERTLQLADRNLRELMTPRNEMCCLDAELGFHEMKHHAAGMRHRRVPIYSDSLDSIVGILNVRRFLLVKEDDIMASIDPPAFVPETMTALELLKNFLRGPQRMALVVDEFGGVEGLITLEDIVEEVFGEIYDEYDDDIPPWQEIEPRVFVARGSARLPAVSRWLGMELDADGIDTLGGWLIDKIGTLPHVGDHYSFAGYFFQIEKMQRWRVSTVIVRDERGKRA